MNDTTAHGFLKLNEVLKLYPISKSGWYVGVNAGIYPKPVKLGERAVAWAADEIADLIERTKAERTARQ